MGVKSIWDDFVRGFTYVLLALTEVPPESVSGATPHPDAEGLHFEAISYRLLPSGDQMAKKGRAWLVEATNPTRYAEAIAGILREAIGSFRRPS